MRFFLVMLVTATLSACAAQQRQLPSTEDALRYEPALEMSLPYPEVRAVMLDGTCMHVLHGWQVVSNEGELILERPDIGRISVVNVGDSYEMLMDLWVDYASERRDEYGGVLTEPDCNHPYGCQVTYVRDESRVHVFQAGGQHVVELTYPDDSHNGQIAIADAIRTAAQVGCPAAE